MTVSLDEATVKQISALLNQIPVHIAQDIENRRKLWKYRQEHVFKDAHNRFDAIRKSMLNPQEFANRDLDLITGDLAFLTAYYTHLVEFEGIAVARKSINERLLYDNLSFLYKGGIVAGKGMSDFKADALHKGFAAVILPLDQELKAASYDMALCGILEDKQTSRADAVKLLVETFKKRHDALKSNKHVEGGNRTT